MTREHAAKAAPTAGPAAAAPLPRARMFLRSMLLQAGWNFQRHQNLGFMAALCPSLDRTWKDPGARREAGSRHLEYFNTNPYMAGFCLGATARLEENIANAPRTERPALESRLHAVKSALAAACAALGDSFFWGTLRPACAVLALLVWGLGALSIWGGAFSRAEAPAALPTWLFFAGAAAYLALFNAAALRTRWVGIERGYRVGEDVAKELKRLPLRAWDRRLRLSAFAATALVGAAGAALLIAQRQWGLLGIAAGYLLLKRMRFSNTALYVSTLLMAYAWALIKP